MIFELLDMLKSSGCVIRSHFHIYCPGCGGTRAVEALLRLQPLQSLYYNPVVILIILFVICILTLNIVEMFDEHKVKHYKMRIAICVTFLTVWFGFFIIRNFLLMYQGIDMLGDFYYQ